MLKRTWLGVFAFAALTVARAATAQGQDIVLYSTDVSNVQGNWSIAASSSGAGGQRVTSNDYGWSTPDAPLASPGDYIEATFSAPSYTTYHVWLRMRATGDSKWNDSVWVQFSDAANTNGSAAYRIGTNDALAVNLEPCSGCGVSGWGWQDKAYWTSQSPLVMFGARGAHTIRIQTREDGPQIDQIVLSPANYLTRAPGQPTNDSTILARSTDGGTGSTGAGTATRRPRPPPAGRPIWVRPSRFPARSTHRTSTTVAKAWPTTTRQRGTAAARIAAAMWISSQVMMAGTTLAGLRLVSGSTTP